MSGINSVSGFWSGPRAAAISKSCSSHETPSTGNFLPLPAIAAAELNLLQVAYPNRSYLAMSFTAVINDSATTTLLAMSFTAVINDSATTTLKPRLN